MKHLVLHSAALGCLALLLAACDAYFGPGELTGYREAGFATLDDSYRAWQAHVSSDGGDTVRATAYVKLTEIGGKLGICGAYVYDGAEDPFSAIPAYFKSPVSFLAIRAEQAPSLHVRTYALADDDLQRLKRASSGSLPAECVVTEIAWHQEYETAPIDLHLNRGLGIGGQGARSGRDPADLIWIPMILGGRH